ncbi:MAG: BamA/TamA family outer membrane protein [Myxococcales bacterium]|nr:BamA/TamA family outer membrane protein [Myxococcales bacterium]
MGLAFVLSMVLSATPEAQTSGPEEKLIQWGLKRRELQLDPLANGKPIDEVFVEREEIFPEENPKFFDILHIKTRDSVVRREVLLKPGDVWDDQRALETERNLRRLFFLSVAKVVPVKAPNGRVNVLVVTQDKWSLRLSNSFTLIGSLLQFLQLTLVEVNFNGWGQSLSIDTVLRLDTFALGQSFTERRLFGSRWSFSEAATIVFNRQTGAAEGTVGQVIVGYPIITLDQPWGFLVDGAWNIRKRRIFRGANVWQLAYPDAAGVERVPFQFDQRELGLDAIVTRRLGDAVKVDLTVTAGAYLRQYTPMAESMLNGDQASWLTSNYLPRSENATFVEGIATAFTNDFRVLKNLDTYELSEDLQLGFRVTGGARWAFPSPLTTQQFIEVGGAARYRLYASDDLFTVSAAGGARIRPGTTIANERFAAEVLNYSPSFHGGRLVTRLLLDFRWNDLNNRQLLLGGSQGLRGTQAEQFTGRNMVLANVEYRTRPIAFVLGTYLGFVLFYDVGTAFDSVPLPQHTAGFGMRLLMPYFNFDVLRFDFGVHINNFAPAPGLDRLNVTWGQVNDLRPAILDSALPP